MKKYFSLELPPHPLFLQASSFLARDGARLEGGRLSPGEAGGERRKRGKRKPGANPAVLARQQGRPRFGVYGSYSVTAAHPPPKSLLTSK